MEKIQDKLRIRKLTLEGHTYRCACEMVWRGSRCKCRRKKSQEKNRLTVLGRKEVKKSG